MSKTKRQAIMILALFMVLGMAVYLSDKKQDTVSQGYLERNEYGGMTYREEVEVTGEMGKNRVTVEVAPRQYTDAEAAGYLKMARKALDKQMAAYNGTAAQDLPLPDSFEGNPVQITWLSTQPLLMKDNGEMSENVPEEGTEVTLIASLYLQDKTEEASYMLKLMPKQLPEEQAFQKKVDELLSAEDPSSKRLMLPREIEGQEVSWSSNSSGRGFFFMIMGVLVSLFYVGAVRTDAHKNEERKRREMMRDYPHIVSKFVLLLGAGMSMRKAFFRMRDDYIRNRQNGGERREGCEAIALVCEDMEKGIPEEEAYRRLGRRSDITLYRTFSVLLVQNLRRGSRELMDLFAGEAANAFEERKKAAKIEGEKASARLLLPMVLMLLVVFVILMVPAFVLL